MILVLILQIDQMSIKIESSRNILNVSAIDPKVRLQMATSVCVPGLIQIDQMSIKIESSRNIIQTCQLQSPKSDFK